jgi:drug/metabolite transporter, DME family
VTSVLTGARRRDLTWLVALAAALWGTDALLRLPLTGTYSAATIVAVEHLLIVLVTLPWLPAAARALRAASPRTRWAVVVIGVGASAVATVLFTMSFQLAGPITPLVLQKLQPLMALLAAWLLLGERLTRRFPLFVVPALAGAWLLAFPDPLGVSVQGAQAALLAVGAAALWGLGTVLGRFAGAELSFPHLTVLRFAIGLPASLVLALGVGAPLTVAAVDLPFVAALALIPGLLALVLYYKGLRRTPASRATLAELAFPVTAAAVGTTVLGAQLTGTQWTGFVLVAAAVSALAVHERTAKRPAIAAPTPVEDAVLLPGRVGAPAAG